ncbi:MAG: HU family DNA-binding protein [bacterium]|nr:HU family DNA-binding protein [bacterium]
MTKAELIEKMATDSKITKAAAGKALDSFTTHVTKSLKRGKRVTLVGFGSFSVVKRKARMGRNPKTGESIKIKAKKVAKFSPGKALNSSL